MALDFKTRPNTLPWPPMIYAAAVLAAVALDRVAPLTFEIPMAVRGLGVVLIVGGLGLDFSAIFTMRRARTNIMPHRAADRLVDWGPFALTRNPIYFGNAVAVVGVAIAVSDAWFLVAAFAAAALTERLAIRREEAHLELRFGDAWRAYAKRTPRWFGWGRARL